MDIETSVEEIEQALDELCEDNKIIPIIVFVVNFFIFICLSLVV